MHTLNDVLVPSLRWLIFRPANRENGWSQALSMQLSDLSITKGLRERRKPLEEISQWRHRSELTGKASLEKSTVQRGDSAGGLAAHEFCFQGKNAGTNRQTVSDHFDALPEPTRLCALHQERAGAARLRKVRT